MIVKHALNQSGGSATARRARFVAPDLSQKIFHDLVTRLAVIKPLGNAAPNGQAPVANEPAQMSQGRRAPFAIRPLPEAGAGA